MTIVDVAIGGMVIPCAEGRHLLNLAVGGGGTLDQEGRMAWTCARCGAHNGGLIGPKVCARCETARPNAVATPTPTARKVAIGAAVVGALALAAFIGTFRVTDECNANAYEARCVFENTGIAGTRSACVTVVVRNDKGGLETVSYKMCSGALAPGGRSTEKTGFAGKDPGSICGVPIGRNCTVSVERE